MAEKKDTTKDEGAARRKEYRKQQVRAWCASHVNNLVPACDRETIGREVAAALSEVFD